MHGQLRFRIPRTHYAGLGKIAKLSDQMVNELVDAIASVPPTFLGDDFIPQVADRITIPRTDTKDIIEVLIGLDAAKNEIDLTIADFLTILEKAIVDSQASELTDAAANWGRIRDILTRLLSVDGSLEIVSKASRLFYHNANVLHDARIVTDVRPIFHQDPSESPAAAIITHSLRLRYHQGDDDDEFFAVLDLDTLRTLRTALVRAEAKEKTLRLLLEQLNIAVVGSDDK